MLVVLAQADLVLAVVGLGGGAVKLQEPVHAVLTERLPDLGERRTRVEPGDLVNGPVGLLAIRGALWVIRSPHRRHHSPLAALAAPPAPSACACSSALFWWRRGWVGVGALKGLR